MHHRRAHRGGIGRVWGWLSHYRQGRNTRSCEQCTVPLVGRVSMDMITVDLSACPRAQVGDPVILWGQGLPLEEVTTYTQSISYQIVTGVQHRVHFMWSKKRTCIDPSQFLNSSKIIYKIHRPYPSFSKDIF